MLERVNFLDNPSKEELASCFADVVTQIAQDVGFPNTSFVDLKVLTFFFCYQMIVTERWVVCFRALFAADHVRGSPFSPNQTGQYFYLVATSCCYVLLVLVMKHGREFQLF